MNKWSIRTGNHKLLIQKRAVLYKGALYLDSVDAVKFHNGDFDDAYEKYSVSKMCPPTPARITKFDASPNGKNFKSYKDRDERGVRRQQARLPRLSRGGGGRRLQVPHRLVARARPSARTSSRPPTALATPSSSSSSAKPARPQAATRRS